VATVGEETAEEATVEAMVAEATVAEAMAEAVAEATVAAMVDGGGDGGGWALRRGLGQSRIWILVTAFGVLIDIGVGVCITYNKQSEMGYIFY